MTVNKKFWKGKKVFLTGHTGFKGSWLSLWLQNMEANVTGYAFEPQTNPSFFVKAGVEQGMQSITGDVRDLESFKQAMSEACPDIVIHMAAQALVHYSYTNPVETYATNVMGTVNLMEAVRATDSVRAVVNITSDKCYENKEWPWGYRENEPMGGYDPYSSSKGCAELVTAAYRNSYFNPDNYDDHGVAVASARAGNVIGGGDWALDRLIPDMIRAIQKEEPVIIRSPKAIRPWQHVLEPLAGYLKLAENLYNNGCDFCGGWNFGPSNSDTKTVEWIIEHMTQAWGPTASWKLDKNVQPHEASYLSLDSSKARMELKWQPSWNIEQTIEKIVEWHKADEQGVDMREFSLTQINDYMNS